MDVVWLTAISTIVDVVGVTLIAYCIGVWEIGQKLIKKADF